MSRITVQDMRDRRQTRLIAYLGVGKLFQQSIILGKWVITGPEGVGKAPDASLLATGLYM